MMKCLDPRVLFLVLGMTALAAPAFAADAPPANDPLVATVDGQQIHQSEVESAYQGSPFQQAPLEQVFPQVLDYVITTRLLATEALKNKLDQDPTVKILVANATTTILAQAYLEKRAAAMVSETDIRARYADMVKTYQGKQEYHIFHIVAASEADAKAVIADLDKGAKFADEAKSKSTDPDVKTNGGDLGFFADDDMSAIPGMADIVTKLKPGAHSAAPLQTQFGWQVLMLTETRAATPPTLDQSRPDITTALQQDAERKAIADLQASAQIQHFGADGKVLPPAKPATPAPATP